MNKRMFLTMLLLLGIIGLGWTTQAAARPQQQPALLPDLTISLAQVCAPGVVDIHATVRNIGSANAGPFNIEVNSASIPASRPPPSPNCPATPTPTQRPTPTCLVTYIVQSQWQMGFVADVTIKNLGTTAVDGWTLAWVFNGDQQIGSMWNAIPAQTGAAASATNADWTRTIAPGGTVNFGFLGSHSSNVAKPSAFTLNGRSCVTEMPTS